MGPDNLVTRFARNKDSNLTWRSQSPAIFFQNRLFKPFFRLCVSQKSLRILFLLKTANSYEKLRTLQWGVERSSKFVLSFTVGYSLVLLYTTLRLKKSRGGSRQLDSLALDNTQLWLVGFYEVQYPLVLVCKVKFYFNSFFLINANLFYQGKRHPLHYRKISKEVS